MLTITKERHQQMANAIRFLAIDAVDKANSGHPGLPMGAADVATVLFSRILKFDATDPNWPDRDRFVLSAGHGSMLLYALLYLTGHEDITLNELKQFRKLHSKTPGHPEYGHTKGVETTTGPLGQGLGNAVGIALAERIRNAHYGDEVANHFTYALVSDGDLMEGISQEVIAFAGHLKLNKLIVLFDDNGISIDGPLSLSDSVDQLSRFQACGWNTMCIDGHDEEVIYNAIIKAQNSDRPTLISCKTKIGFGSPNRVGTAKAHGAPLGNDETQQTRQTLDWPHEPFDVPSEILDLWRLAGLRGKHEHTLWQERFETLDPELQAEFSRTEKGDISSSQLDKAIEDFKHESASNHQEIATRKASELVLDVVTQAIPELIGGSADLTGSNNTKTKIMQAINADNFSGRYIHYGIREHGMAAIMNGMALHGGIVPYGGTFLVFSDYCRPSIRLAALIRIRIIYVFTHDSIGVGEDGPTHQPVEHLAALRTIPNVRVFRPCDVVETAECWQAALSHKDGPSVLALTRQALPQLRKQFNQENLSSIGAYELGSSDKENHNVDISLFASGSEVHLACEAQQELENAGISTRVVSVPCLDILRSQSKDIEQSIVGSAKVNIVVEAGIEQGWESITCRDGAFIGMTGFGASAPYKDLYRHFGITVEQIVNQAKKQLEIIYSKEKTYQE